MLIFITFHLFSFIFLIFNNKICHLFFISRNIIELIKSIIVCFFNFYCNSFIKIFYLTEEIQNKIIIQTLQLNWLNN